MVLAALVQGSGAAAQDRPRFPPGRDVAVTYRTAVSQPGAPSQVVVRYSVQADRLRVEAGLPSYLLIDRRSRRGTIVMEPLGIVADLPARAGLDQALMLETGKRFTRRGAETVAGLRCTVWDVAADAGTGTACVTADGVLLRATGRDKRGQTGSLEATRVDYAPQDGGLFVVPASLRKVDLPPALLGAAAGVGGGGASGSAGSLSGPGVGAVLDRLRARP